MDATKFTFRIKAYTPETIPMARLAEYLAQYAALMGNQSSVHFDGLRKGSTILCSRVEEAEVPKVEVRLRSASEAEASADVAKVVESINRMLREDNADGYIRREKGAKIIAFPGIKQPIPERIGPIREAGRLEGRLVKVGGKDRTIHALLIAPDGEQYRLVTTSIDTAKDLGRHLYTNIRVSGTGTWFRDENRQWVLDQFFVQDFESSNEQSLIEAITGLRAVEGSGWGAMEDPLSELKRFRQD